MGRDSFLPRMKEENERSWSGGCFLGKFSFFLISCFQTAGASCVLLSMRGNLSIYHRNCRLHQPTPLNSVLGTLFAVLEPLPCTSTGTCSCWWRHYLEIIFQFLSSWFSFRGNTPFLNLWRKCEKKGKLDAIVIFTLLLHSEWKFGMRMRIVKVL